MVKKVGIKFVSLIFILVVSLSSVYASTYGNETYGADCYGEDCPISCGDGICNGDETCSTCSADCGQCSSSSSSSSGGGSGGGCTYDWQCTNWFPSICPDTGIQERVCVNKGTCSGTTNMPNETRECEYLGPTEPLFDIYLTLDDYYKEMCSGNKIRTEIKLENYAKVELLDAFMTYWIIDENNKLIAELKDTRAVEKEMVFNIEMQIPKSTPAGTYRIYSEITYSGNKTALSGESFEILSQEQCGIFSEKGNYFVHIFYKYLWIILTFAILILITIIVIVLMRRKSEVDKIIKKGREHLKKGNIEDSKKHYSLLRSLYESKYKGDSSIYKKIIDYYNSLVSTLKGKSMVLLIAGFIFAGIFFTGSRITGFVVGNYENKSFGIAIIFLIFVLGLLTYFYKERIFEKLKKKFSENSIKGIIGKKVYTKEGDYIGKVQDVCLIKNKIESLKISTRKKKIKGIVLKYKNVKGVGKIVLIDDIKGHLENFKK